MSTDELRAAVNAAEQALVSVRNQRLAASDEARRQANAAVDAEFGPRMDEATARLGAAQAALIEAEQRALPNEILIEWRRSGASYAPGPWNKSGLRGKYEIMTPQTVLVGVTYNRPNIGERFIRLLTANGKPGKRFVSFSISAKFRRWLPQGETPSDEKRDVG